MKLKHYLVLLFCLVVSIGTIAYFYRIDNQGYKCEYISTGKFISGYEVYAEICQSGLPASREIVVFATSEYKYIYSISMSNDEHVVEVDNEFIPLSRFLITHFPISYEEIEESKIGRRVYWEEMN